MVLPPDKLNRAFDFDPSFRREVSEYKEALGGSLHIAASRSYGGDDAKKLHRIAHLAKKLDMLMVATNDVHYHHPERRELQDFISKKPV